MTEVFPIKIKKGTLINYTYVVVNKMAAEALVIDPGFEFDAITAPIYNMGVRLKAVLLTHHHADHVHSAAALAQAFDVPVYISSVECGFYHFECSNLKTLQPDQLFSTGDFDVFCHHTPGHTKGSTCFQIGDHLFTGDTLFIEGCGLCSGAGADATEMYHSLKKLRRLIEPLVRIYPGHSFGAGPGVVFNYVLKENIYLQIPELDRFVAFRMRKNQNGLFNFK